MGGEKNTAGCQPGRHLAQNDSNDSKKHERSAKRCFTRHTHLQRLIQAVNVFISFIVHAFLHETILNGREIIQSN